MNCKHVLNILLHLMLVLAVVNYVEGRSTGGRSRSRSRSRSSYHGNRSSGNGFGNLFAWLFGSSRTSHVSSGNSQSISTVNWDSVESSTPSTSYDKNYEYMSVDDVARNAILDVRKEFNLNTPPGNTTNLNFSDLLTITMEDVFQMTNKLYHETTTPKVEVVSTENSLNSDTLNVSKQYELEATNRLEALENLRKEITQTRLSLSEYFKKYDAII